MCINISPQQLITTQLSLLVISNAHNIKIYIYKKCKINIHLLDIYLLVLVAALTQTCRILQYQKTNRNVVWCFHSWIQHFHSYIQTAVERWFVMLEQQADNGDKHAQWHRLISPHCKTMPLKEPSEHYRPGQLTVEVPRTAESNRDSSLFSLNTEKQLNAPAVIFTVFPGWQHSPCCRHTHTHTHTRAILFQLVTTHTHLTRFGSSGSKEECLHGSR